MPKVRLAVFHVVGFEEEAIPACKLALAGTPAQAWLALSLCSSTRKNQAPIDQAVDKDKCKDCVVNETLGRISIALNFSHQLNPNLVISK